MRIHTVSSLHLCPQCGVGIVRARSLTAGEIADGVARDSLGVIGCCATAQSSIKAIYSPAAVVAAWPEITAEAAVRGFCPDCGDTAIGCRILQKEVDGLEALVDAEIAAMWAETEAVGTR
ncbi:hypothetical protein Br6_04841 [Rhodococcus sp. Br-6]|nr:hypothetical protein Br6_04841 [Rhodococcus sp. Br-6]